MSISGRVPGDEELGSRESTGLRIIRAQVASPTHVQFSERLIDVHLPAGLPTVDDIVEELHEYCDILLGRVDSPIHSPYLALAEVATAYYARALEIEGLIHEYERSGDILRGSDFYRLRTGQLRSFIDLSKRLADLGSRRLTQETVLYQQRRDAGES